MQKACIPHYWKEWALYQLVTLSCIRYPIDTNVRSHFVPGIPPGINVNIFTGGVTPRYKLFYHCLSSLPRYHPPSLSCLFTLRYFLFFLLFSFFSTLASRITRMKLTQISQELSHMNHKNTFPQESFTNILLVY
jgi:hypothetical protein